MRNKLLLAIATLLALVQVTTGQVLLKPITRHLDATKGLQVEYTLSLGEYKQEGVYYGVGKQFYIESTDIKAWYNGQDLWLYVAQNGEVNLTRPTPEELVELNPLLALELLNEKDFNLTHTANRLTAIPRGKPLARYKKLEVLLGAQQQPKEVKVLEQGQELPLIIKVKSLKLTTSEAMKQRDFFTFTPKKLPGVAVIDLR